MQRVTASLGPWGAIAAAVALTPGQLMAQTCNWPLVRRIDRPAEYATTTIGTLPQMGGGQLMAGGVVRVRTPQPQPRRDLVSPHLYSIVYMGLSPSLGPDLVETRFETSASLAETERNLEGLIHATPAWQEFQSRLNCENGADDYQHRLDLRGERLFVVIAFRVKRKQCFPGGSVQIGAARVTIEAEIQARGAGDHVEVALGEVQTRVESSPEQSAVLGLIGGGVLFGPIGAQLGVGFSGSISSAIRNAVPRQFEGLDLATALPAPSLGRLRLTIDRANFHRLNGELMVRSIGQVAGGLRAHTACAWANRQPYR